MGERADSPPAGDTTEFWRKDIGLRSPLSGSEVIYCSPESYYESPASPSLSPAASQKDKLEKELDEITTNSNIMSGQEGKTPSELDAVIADYHSKVQDSRIQAMVRCRKEDADYMKAAQASVVSAHIEHTRCHGFPPNIKQEAMVGRATSLPERVTTEEVY